MEVLIEILRIIFQELRNLINFLRVQNLMVMDHLENKIPFHSNKMMFNRNNLNLQSKTKNHPKHNYYMNNNKKKT